MNVNPRLDVGRQTHPGRVRQRNEDSFGLPPPDLSQEVLAAKGYLYLVADGMGGYQGGQWASQMAAQRIVQEYYRDPSPDLEHSLARAIRMANAQIYQEARRTPELQKMGTTVTAAVVRGHELLVANVGDSRTYLVRGGVARQLTEDHSFIAQGLKQGVITSEQAEKHPYRGVITRALGGEPDVQPDFFREQLRPGDAILLCSDGLSNEVDNQQIAAIVGHSKTAQEAAGRLVDQANQHGGRDNITAIVVGVDGRRPAGMADLPPWLLPLAGGLLAVALVFVVLLAFPGGQTLAPTSGMSPPATPVIGPPTQEIAMATPPGTPGTGGSSQTAEGFPTATTTAMTETQPPTSTLALSPTVTAIPSPTSTLALSPTVTAIPSPTFTAMPSPSAPPSATPTAPRLPKPPGAESTATAMPTRFLYPAPTLLMPEAGANLEPQAGANLSSRFRFTWRYDGPPLEKDYAFDLRIWLEQDKDRPKEQRQGAIKPTQQTEIEVDLDNVPAIRQYGRGVYYWGVVVVRMPDCYPRCSVEIVGEWSEEREFTYRSPSPSCKTFNCDTNCTGKACEDPCWYCCGGCRKDSIFRENRLTLRGGEHSPPAAWRLKPPAAARRNRPAAV